MFVLLASSQTAPDGADVVTAELPHQAIDVPFVGIVDEGHLLAVA